MRRVLVASAILLALLLMLASFNGGRVAERRAQQWLSVRAQASSTAPSAKQNRLLANETDPGDHVLIANVATVSFGELWDVMRAAAPERRAAWAREIEQLPHGTRRNAAAKSFFKIWAELDPVAAVQGIEVIRDKRLQSLAFYSSADAAADSALPAFAELENRLGYRTNNFSATSVLARWASADAPAVARFLEAHPQTAENLFMDATYNWANAEPEKAGEWFVNLRLSPFTNPEYPRAEDRRRFEAARGLLSAWLDKDSLGAAAFAAKNADDPDIKKALGEFALALCTKSHEQATSFIQSLPNEDAQRAALTDLFQHLGHLITWREGGDDEEPEEPEINPDEIPPWLVALPPKLWIDHVGEILDCWDTADPARADAWLRALPSEAKSKAIVDYCAGASLEQAGRVLELAALISDVIRRNEVLQKFVNDVSDDPSETRAKIAALPLSDGQKRTLLRRLRRD